MLEIKGAHAVHVLSVCCSVSMLICWYVNMLICCQLLCLYITDGCLSVDLLDFFFVNLSIFLPVCLYVDECVCLSTMQ